MAKQTSRYRLGWLLLVAGFLAWTAVGCNPQSLSVLLMPFQGDDGVQPEYKMFVKDKEVTLAIVTNFPKQDHRSETKGADNELAEQLAMAFRQRCEANKHKLKLIPMALVRSNQLKQQVDGGDYSPVTLGTVLKADYVLDLNVESFSLYEKGNISKMYHGTTEISINLYKIAAKDGEPNRVRNKEYRCSHPRNGVPIDSSSLSVTAYRNAFAATVANDIAKLFIAYSPDEKHQME